MLSILSGLLDKESQKTPVFHPVFCGNKNQLSESFFYCVVNQFSDLFIVLTRVEND